MLFCLTTNEKFSSDLTLAPVQAHADNLQMQAMMVTSEPAKAEVATKAESLKAQAQSLEARAEAQNLQVRLPDVADAGASVVTRSLQCGSACVNTYHSCSLCF
jgi:hypothetical protein